MVIEGMRVLSDCDDWPEGISGVVTYPMRSAIGQPRWTATVRPIICVAVVAGLLLAGTGFSTWAQEAYTAEEILAGMAFMYANCLSYYDSGIVTTLFIEGTGERTVEKPFTTAFIRPDRFRFEYSEMNRFGMEYRYIAWQEGSLVETWWSLRPEINTEPSLAHALAACTGISGGSAHTIPALLLPAEIAGRKLIHMTKLKRLADGWLNENGEAVEAETAEGLACYRIQGLYAEAPMTVWIDKGTLMVRRIDRRRQHDGFRTETTTTYIPVLNHLIPEDFLAFNPPDEE